MEKKSERSPLKTYILLITYAVLLVMFFIQKNEIFGVVGKILGCLNPFLYGIVIAYILNMPLRFIEEKIFPKLFKKVKKRKPHLEHGCAVALTMLLAVALVTAIVSVFIPQLVGSVVVFIGNIEGYVASLEIFVNGLAERFNLNEQLWQQIQDTGAAFVDNIVVTLQGSLPQILNTTKNVMTSVFGGVFNILMSAIISVYLLYHKEKLVGQVKNLFRAFLPEKITSFLLETGRYANDIFGKFIGGQLTEALILGVLCFIGSSILGIQYALLISVIIAVTNLIPIFGPWIGTAISTFILLMVDPVKALWFVIFILVLQQLENNLIYPKVVGSSIRLSGLWVIFAIIVGGGLFGIGGIFLGIPLCAVVGKLSSDYIGARLKRREQCRAEIPKTDEINDTETSDA